ncbi:hypothetical protein [Actinophytocola gossypii]|uniref:ESX-1 secretion-associated protein n=1 Tax=Actinophytocola gossypii TaxID=2812003 RepID=A0ABT2JCP5_9PSEU|nr:hypothetical protein [Actinophytocola gossypii]MCT2585627.1 hypothetical protein [Actinophytocola gossypii]
MTGFMEMNTDTTSRFMDGMATVADTFATGWASAKGDITAAEAGIGTDVLAAAFVAGYRTRTDSLVAALDRVPEVYRAMSAAGQRCVAEYRTADEASAAALNQVSSGGVARWS